MSVLNPIRGADRFPAGEVYRQKIEYSGSNPIYIGYAPNIEMDEDADGWTIQKISYNGDNNVTDIQFMHLVAWADRALLPWGS